MNDIVCFIAVEFRCVTLDTAHVQIKGSSGMVMDIASAEKFYDSMLLAKTLQILKCLPPKAVAFIFFPNI